jgi:hypothetical protein
MKTGLRGARNMELLGPLVDFFEGAIRGGIHELRDDVGLVIVGY